MADGRGRRAWQVGAVALVLGLALSARVHVGFFRGREWGELRVFLKHRPSLTAYFSSPLGEADSPREGLPPEQARQEAEYVDFVETHGGWGRSVVLVP
jgi:hypothetical protein